MLHKLRILLTENLLNAVEHAHHEQQSTIPQYFAVYARVRQEASLGDVSRLTKAIERENSRCPALSSFIRDCDCSWIEVFCYDDGRGLLADIKKWKENAGERLRKKLEKIKETTNVLHSVSRFIFKEALSKNSRGEKSILTGLQHVGLVLTDGNDYARVYSQGEWVGATYPWADNVHGASQNLNKRKEYIQKSFSRGTAWHYCIRLNSRQDHLRTWPGDRILACDVEAEASPLQLAKITDWDIFDERDLGHGINYSNWKDACSNKLHCLWLPGAITKQRVYQYLTALINTQQTAPVFWLIADISKEQARTINSILKSQRSQKSFPQVHILIVTSDWYLLYLKNNESRTSLKEGSEVSCRQMAMRWGRTIFELLRNHDTHLFWSEIPKSKDRTADSTAAAMESPFITELIIWDRDDEGKHRVVLEGYLDLTQALVDTKRMSVAARSLRRLWYLFARDAKCVASDELLTSLLPQEAKQSPVVTPSNSEKDSTKGVVVNSILVMGSTFLGRYAKEGHKAIHLLRHSRLSSGHDYIPDFVKETNSFALNWIDKPIDLSEPPPGHLEYERIPGTPYIGRGGSKAIPVRRFERKSNTIKFFEKSIYAQNPNDTYEHFLRLGLLKLGHWVYGAHHDLITLNLGLAIDRESLNHGPIIKWLCSELAYQKTLGANLVVYPSHPVTEKLVQAIKKNLSCADGYDCQDHFIPLHFLGSHTQTSIRIPSLTYDRIKYFLTKNPDNRCHINTQRVILLDDGALTGKVQRELEQLLRNAGAKSVIHVGIVTRMGLPLYRQYLVSDYKDGHRFYWRWDVPPLGSARTCPLCRAIQQAQEIAGTLWSKNACAEVRKWANTWVEQPVATARWWSSGLIPAQLPENRPLTFGKEWDKSNGKVTNYSIIHTTTTGLASAIIELIRTTSYKDVGVKLAHYPWPKDWSGDKSLWRRARLEILISQTLLFFDDFNHDEIVTRLKQILEVLGSPSNDAGNSVLNSIDSLACLTLILATDRQAHDVVLKIAPHLSALIDAPQCFYIAFGLLIRRGNLSDEQIFHATERRGKLSDGNNSALQSLLVSVRTLVHGRELIGTMHGLRMLTMLLGESSASMHTGFLSKRLAGEIGGGRDGLMRDLNMIYQAFDEIDPLVCDASLPQWNKKWFLEKTGNLIQTVEHENTSSPNISDFKRNELSDEITTLARAFRDTFLTSAIEIESTLRSAVTHLLFSETLQARDETIKKRWGFRMDGEHRPTFRLPMIKTNLKECLLNDKNRVVYPPVGRQMILDSLLDVIHSKSKYPDESDMHCDLSIHDNKLAIKICNLATEEDRIATIKVSEVIYQQYISQSPIRRKFDTEKNEMIVEIELPLITSLE